MRIQISPLLPNLFLNKKGVIYITKRKPIEYYVDDNGCFICTSHSKDKLGYNIYHYNGNSRFMHRYIYEQCFGEIPKGMVIRHLCNNPSCINPEHLKIGTHYDNVQDRVKANRSAVGSNNGRSKLNEEDVIEIKNNNSTSLADLAIIYDVTSKVISNIKNNKNWKHVHTKIEPAPLGINKGSEVKTSKLTEEDVVLIKQLLEQNYGVRELGKMFNVSHPQISRIKNNKAWKHVT